MTTQFEVGQQVWFQPTDRRDAGRYVTITKIGRIYYTVDDHLTFDKETLSRVNYPHGRLYPSEQAKIDSELAQEMLQKLNCMYHLRPTLEQMQKVFEILEIPPLKEK